MTYQELTNAIAAANNDEADIAAIVLVSKQDQVEQLIDDGILEDDWFGRWFDIQDEFRMDLLKKEFGKEVLA